MENRLLDDIINEEYRNFALYTVENRAIPSCIDGLKPVQRKVLYAMIEEHHGRKTKIAELGSIAKHNYHHGENSAMQAAIGMAAPYLNIVPVLKADGNFGTRLIQEASAPRYIFALQSDKFEKYFTDFEVVDKSRDPENPEPQTYLPLIPWVLVNGISGIAVGFANKIMPHDPKDLVKATLAVLKGKKQPTLTPVFPDFNGPVELIEHDKLIVKGIVNRIKRNTWEITEVPYGLDRAGVYEILTEMEAKGKIETFEDGCDKKGFRFIVKVNNANDVICSEDPITFFKMYKKITENYTTLDEKGQLKVFDSKKDIVEYFVQYRLKKVAEKLKWDSNQAFIKMRWLLMKRAFTKWVCDNNINFRDKKRDEWGVIVKDLLLQYVPSDEEIVKILNTPVCDLTVDHIEKDQIKINELQTEIKVLDATDPKEHYIEQLEKLLKLI